MKTLLLWISLLLPSIGSVAQTDSLSDQSERLSLFENAPTFNKVRFWGMTTGILTSYSLATIGLNQAWYANYPRSSFHTFDDWSGWRRMDKFGHAMTGYFESKWIGDLYIWMGVPQREARWIGFGAGLLFQTTLEVMDGFSDQWGFSWGDMGFNVLGSGTYLAQELLWKEQRIRWKLSAHRPRYSTAPIHSTNGAAITSLKERAAQLYGNSPAELFFKEYNGQTIWLSANVASFLPKTTSKTPFQWVNVAVGYGIEQVYGAEQNSWEDAQGNHFAAPTGYERQSQFFVSLDIDFERIPTRHKWLKTVFGVLNIFKIPFPALEINTAGGVHFHPFYF
ncbi:MAG: DUF2279 domain-containing protein [Aureispira sp.]